MSVSGSQALRFVPLSATHLPEILEIEKEAYPEPWTDGMFREEINHARSYFVVVMLGDDMAGYGGFWPLLDEAHITSVTVKGSLRGMGYGRCLLAHLLQKAAEDGARMATLEVRESNVPARALYDSFGFDVSGRRHRYYPKTGEDALIMTKLLNR